MFLANRGSVAGFSVSIVYAGSYLDVLFETFDVFLAVVQVFEQVVKAWVVGERWVDVLRGCWRGVHGGQVHDWMV